MKRTDLGDETAGPPEALRRDFFRREEEDAGWGRSEARAKSAASEGSLGLLRVEDVVSVGLPWNCAARSLYCACRFCSVSASVLDALFQLSAQFSCHDSGKPTLSLQPLGAESALY